MSSPKPPCSHPKARDLDFWLGEWDLSWPAEQVGGEEGSRGFGTNRITKLFGECVIEENFETSDGAFLGRSVSVFDVNSGMWRQTWVDSAGGYLVFTGGADGEGFELRTDPVERDGEVEVNRMVFRDVAVDSLQWDWQGSKDGGETWSDLWNISYVRKG